MKSAILILPNQLFEQHDMFKASSLIYLYEHPAFFTELKFHKQKLVFHRATLKAYEEYLQQRGFKVRYLEYRDDVFDRLKSDAINQIHIADVVDNNLELVLKKEAKKNHIELAWYENPNFINTLEDIQADFKEEASHYFMTSFYIKQRKRLNILIKDGKPFGGKWSFDPENRKKVPSGLSIPSLWHPKTNNFVKEAINYVQLNFSTNYGAIDTFFYPVTYKDSDAWLEDFLKNRLEFFGAYEDAIESDSPFLFHSLISPLLNVGLLRPLDVVNRALEFAEKKSIPLNSLEGFIRQIIGWREYMRGIYTIKGEQLRNSNFFKNDNQLPLSFWEGTTSLEILDILINQLMKTAYLHHIERLMVFGNFMLLCSIHPHEVYRWFMENFIDAYDWVMVPNVYGMSQFSDGGSMITKPYISGSNYLLKMSNFKKGYWSEIWDALFWNFIHQHKEKLEKIPRFKIMLSYLKKMEEKKLKNYLRMAKQFLSNFKKV